jgi:deoxyhypusine synthase
MQREELLRDPTEPMTIFPERDFSGLASSLSRLGLEARRLGEAIDIWSSMLKRKRIMIWMGLSGAMIPAGMRKLICYLIRRRMIDVLVTTGATLYHDCYEVMMGKHFLGSDSVDDVMLRKHQIDRVYDTYADESKLYRMDNIIDKQFCEFLKDEFTYSTRGVMQEFGKWLSQRVKDKDSLSVCA